MLSEKTLENNMSGHSKWSKIKRKKGSNDAKRSKIFSKLIKEVHIATRLGGPDVDANPRLRLAIQNAKGVNMPKENIDRAIKKASVEDATSYQEVTYEGYGQAGVAIFVECTTDNINRTVANVRATFNKFGGNLGTNGSLEFIFDQKGIFHFQLPSGIDEDELILEIIDAGAEDVEIDENNVTVTTLKEDFGSVQKKLESMKIEPEEAGLQRIPKIFKKISKNEVEKVMKLIEILEEDEDVQNVFHNIEMNEETLAFFENN